MVLRMPGAPDSHPLDAREIPEPLPGPGEIRLRVLVCGVCRTDLHITEGELPVGKPDLVPGHQVVGVVDRIGETVRAFRMGETVGVTWLHSTCGHCEYCVSGRENLCESARFTGLDADGGYAQAMIVPASHAFRLPESLSPHEAAPLLCAGVIGYRSLKVSGIRPGQNLGLYGFGASAHLTLQVALHWGCQVHVFTRSEAHRKHALSLGAVWAGALEDLPPESMHAAVTFAPSGKVAATALSRLRRGGTVAVNAVHMDLLPALPYSLLYHERCIRSVANLTREDVREFLDLAAQERIHARVNRFRLGEANLALERIKASDLSGASVLDIPL